MISERGIASSEHLAIQLGNITSVPWGRLRTLPPTLTGCCESWVTQISPAPLSFSNCSALTALSWSNALVGSAAAPRIWRFAIVILGDDPRRF